MYSPYAQYVKNTRFYYLEPLTPQRSHSTTIFGLLWLDTPSKRCTHLWNPNLHRIRPIMIVFTHLCPTAIESSKRDRASYGPVLVLLDPICGHQYHYFRLF